MKRRLILSITILSSLLFGAVVVCWIGSRGIQVTVAWSSGKAYYQIISYNGSVYVVRLQDWWRKEPLAIQVDRQPGKESMTTWPGMRIDRHFEALGLMKVTGKWISPYTEVTKDTEFTSPEISIAPGTMYASTVPMTIHGVSYWLLFTVPILWWAALGWCKLPSGSSHRIEKQNDFPLPA